MGVKISASFGTLARDRENAYAFDGKRNGQRQTKLEDDDELA
jgi:hypothetical protein